jgi:hypothetical protein
MIDRERVESGGMRQEKDLKERGKGGKRDGVKQRAVAEYV